MAAEGVAVEESGEYGTGQGGEREESAVGSGV